MAPGAPPPATMASPLMAPISVRARSARRTTLQRVMIAIAISCDPELLVADEATTALVVTLQAEIIELLRRLRDKRGLAVLFVWHDLAVVAELCDRVVVFYAGGVVESGPAAEIIERPRHPHWRPVSAPRRPRAARAPRGCSRWRRWTWSWAAAGGPSRSAARRAQEQAGPQPSSAGELSAARF